MQPRLLATLADSHHSVSSLKSQFLPASIKDYHESFPLHSCSSGPPTAKSPKVLACTRHDLVGGSGSRVQLLQALGDSVQPCGIAVLCSVKLVNPATSSAGRTPAEPQQTHSSFEQCLATFGVYNTTRLPGVMKGTAGTHQRGSATSPKSGTVDSTAIHQQIRHSSNLRSAPPNGPKTLNPHASPISKFPNRFRSAVSRTVPP